LHQAQTELAQRVQERTAIEERQRLARELHDSASQALYGISLGAHTALTVLESDTAKVLEALNYVLSLTEAALTEMRALIFELHPESLAMEDLATVLNKQVAAVRARHGIQVQTDLCQEPDVPLQIKEAVYRIAQEALNKAMKHAHPSRLEVKLICDSESVLLEVRDDGVGFDPQASYPGHLGLRSMRERASSVGGALEIDSVPGCGTRIRAHIPTRAVELEPSA
jgi:signal transduction histidine kinase